MYSVYIITVSAAGSLGINVKECNDSLHDNRLCVVHEVRASGIGDKHGVKLNDIICLPPTESAHLIKEVPYYTPNQIKEADFEEVVKWASSPIRPITFAVKRIDIVTSKCTTRDYAGYRNLSKNKIDRAIQGRGARWM